MVNNLNGMQLGQYQVIELLDDNGIIQTYLAIQMSLNRRVALHVVGAEYRNGSVWQKALIRGAELCSQLEHPNIVPVIDRGRHEDIDYVVVRLTEGGSLSQRMKTGQFQLREVATVINQLAGALDYVHSLGQYHGDPASINITFDKFGNAYLAEFYLAGLLETTIPEQPAGVPQFMAPERMLAYPPGPETDQYSLACIAYYMLTGEFPWSSQTRARRPETIIIPQEHRSEIPFEVNDVLLKALAREPEDRYLTIKDFARAFDNRLKDTDSYIFISYSRRDTDFAHKLREDLQARNLPIWIDDEIEHGDNWFNEINDAIKSSSAVIVMMSPGSEQSEWVHKEILLAKRYKKPIYPILLSGDEFPILIDIQFAKIEDNQLPDNDFYRRISRVIYGD